MKIISRVMATLAFAGWVGNASAVPISTADIVNVGGQEWAQVNLFTNNSWDAINAQCPGGTCLTTSTINGYDLDGWAWASIYDVKALFEIFTGTTNRSLEVNSTWGPEMAALFDPTVIHDYDHPVVGLTSTSSTYYYGRVARFVDGLASYQYDSTHFTINAPKSRSSSYEGAWFVRDPLQIPAPTTLALFGLGLVSLGMFRRKHAAKV